jgi:hypothetical protein
MKNQTEAAPLLCALSPIRRTTLQIVLIFSAIAMLAGCAGGPPPPPPPEDPAQAKADAKARDDFARSLPKPPEH